MEYFNGPFEVNMIFEHMYSLKVIELKHRVGDSETTRLINAIGKMVDNDKSACKSCAAKFSLIRWRHLCELCKHTFCDKCCNRYILAPFALGSQERNFLRVCDDCYGPNRGFDSSVTYDVFKPAPEVTNSRTIIMLPGAGGARVTQLPQVFMIDFMRR